MVRRSIVLAGAHDDNAFPLLTSRCWLGFAGLAEEDVFVLAAVAVLALDAGIEHHAAVGIERDEIATAATYVIGITL